MSLVMWWPIALLVFSNVFYQVCSKSMPKELNPLAATSLTYLVGALIAFLVYLLMNPHGNFFGEYKHLNWAPFVLGFAIVGLEAGAMCMYRVGWNISTGQLVFSTICSITLIFVGALAYHETITLTKLAGIAFCLVGLILINR